MKQIMSAAVLAALTVGGSVAVTAQSPAGAAKQTGQQVTVQGCVQREADYRKTMDKGRGGVAGTGVGAADEYVLTNLMMTGTASEKPAAGAAYELTGENEKLAAKHVGHKVEIAGMLKAAEVGASGAPTGGATAGTPPRGVDVMSKDLQLRELEVTSLKMISADCAK